jgi:hypothetical protein
MAVLDPSGTPGFNITTFRKKAAPATYQEMVFIPMIEDYGMRLGTTGTVRKAARMTSTVLAQSAPGTSLTPSTMIDTAATLTAAGNYVEVAWSQNEIAQLDLALGTLASGEVERALAEGSDTIALANVTSATQTMSQAAVDAPMFRQAAGRLGQNTNGMAGPGKEQIYTVFSFTQLPALQSIPEYNSAELRGDSENPYVKGVWMRGGGVLLSLSTAVAQDANGWHNPMFIREALQIGWNTGKAEVEQQKFELQNKVIAFNNFGSGIVHQLRLIVMRTTASQL